MSLYNIDLEKSVLASLMTLENLLAESGLDIQESDFYSQRHQTIFKVIKRLYDDKEGFDVIMVMDALIADDELELAGGEDYLGDILANSPATKFNFASYVKRIQDLAKRRQVKELFQSKLDAITAGKDNSIDELISDTIQDLNKTTLHGDTGYQLAKDLLAEFWENFEAKERGEVAPYIDTGFVEFSNKLGLNNGDLVILAGRPSMGKSTFAQNLFTLIAKNTGKVGVFFSLEMPKQMVMERLVSAVGNVHLTTVKTGGQVRPLNESREDYIGGISEAMEFLNSMPLVIEDKAGITIGEIRSKLNLIRHEQGEIGVIVVDYIGLMGGITDDIVNSIGEITKQLKAIAKDFNCPVIALSQLNRSLENRPDKRPKMSDLRDSGKVEQDADQIIAIYRDEVYHERTAENADLAEALILKNRNGATGKVLLTFQGHYSRFTDFITMPEDEAFGGNHA